MGLSDPFVAASVQMDIHIGQIAANVQRAVALLHTAADQGARLIVFPECTTSGYCFDSLDDALPLAIPRDDPALHPFVSACRERAVVGILGFLERSTDGGVYNSALVVSGTEEMEHLYRKTHLPVLGVDRFVSRGDDLPVFHASGLNLGALICYDVRFPEAARVLALRHADVIALPTNWPEGAESAPAYMLRARARENGCYIVAANRVGFENGRRFIGQSQIVAPSGEVLAQAGTDEETIFAEITAHKARRKRIVIEPGCWEQDTVGDRRPELYGELTA